MVGGTGGSSRSSGGEDDRGGDNRTDVCDLTPVGGSGPEIGAMQVGVGDGSFNPGGMQKRDGQDVQRWTASEKVELRNLYLDGPAAYTEVYVEAPLYSGSVRVSLEMGEDAGDVVALEHWFEVVESRGDSTRHVEQQRRSRSFSPKLDVGPSSNADDGYDSSGCSSLASDKDDDDVNGMFSEMSAKPTTVEVEAGVRSTLRLWVIVRSCDSSDMGKRNSMTVLQGSVRLETLHSDDHVSSSRPRRVPLTLQVCQSVLECNASQLVFYACVPHKSYHKDFTVWNRSEILLALRCVSLSSEVVSLHVLSDEGAAGDVGASALEDGKAFREASRKVFVPGYGHTRIRVSFTPQAQGEFKHHILIENVNNPSNSESIALHTSVGALEELVNPFLVRLTAPSGGNSSNINSRHATDSELRSVTFDDCLLGDVVAKRLRIKNRTDHELECVLSSSSPFVRFSVDDQEATTREATTREATMREATARKTKTNLPEGNRKDVVDLLDGSARSDSSNAVVDKEEEEHMLCEEEDKVNSTDALIKTDSRPLFGAGRGDRGENVHTTNKDIEEDNKSIVTTTTGGVHSSEFSKSDFAQSKGKDDKFDEEEEDDDDEMSDDDDDYDEEAMMTDKVDNINDNVGDKGDGSAAHDDVDNVVIKKKKKKKEDNANAEATKTVLLAPGMEKVVVVYYRPGPIDANENEFKSKKHAYQLRRRDFLLHLSSMTLPATCRVCKNGVRLSPPELSFGDCNIGVLKAKTVRITSLSGLISRIKVRIRSKVISLYLDGSQLVGGDGGVFEASFVLEPHMTRILTVEFVARKVNLNYVKEIMFEAVDYNATLTVRASNMDSHHIIYHSLFYKLNPKIKHFSHEVLQGQQSKVAERGILSSIDFGEIVYKSPCLRSFEVENITDKPITLRFSTSTKVLSCYVLGDNNLEATTERSDGDYGGSSEAFSKSPSGVLDRFSVGMDMDMDESSSAQKQLNKGGRNSWEGTQGKKSYDDSFITRSSGEGSAPKVISRPRFQSATVGSPEEPVSPVSSRTLIRPKTTEHLLLGGVVDDTHDAGLATKTASITVDSGLEDEYDTFDVNANPSIVSARMKSNSGWLSPDLLRTRRIKVRSQSQVIHEDEVSTDGGDDFLSDDTRAGSFSRFSLLGARHGMLLNDSGERQNGLRREENNGMETAFLSMSTTSLEKLQEENTNTVGGSGGIRAPRKSSILQSSRSSTNTSTPNLSSSVYVESPNDVNVPHIAGGWEALCDEFERPQKLYFSGMEPKEETGIVEHAERRNDALTKALYRCAPLKILTIPPRERRRIGVVLFLNNRYADGDENGFKEYDGASGKLRSVTETIWIEQLQLDDADMERIRRIHLWGQMDREGADTAEEIRLDKRALPVSAKVGRSIMSFAQRHINFGTINLPCLRFVKSLYLSNGSALPLLYKIQKSRSFSSGFLRIIRNPLGMVRPFGTKEIQFEFFPTMPGRIDEKLTVLNILDRSSSEDISIKAVAVRSHAFKVDTSQLHFYCDNEGSRNSDVQLLAIRNVHTKPREFAVRLKDSLGTFGLRFSSYASSTRIPKDVGEEIEHLQQKLRIAETKAQTKKLVSIRAQLQALFDQSANLAKDKTPLVALPSGGAKLVVPPEATARVKLQAYIRSDCDVPLGSKIWGSLQIFQIKNKDAVIDVPILLESGTLAAAHAAAVVAVANPPEGSNLKLIETEDDRSSSAGSVPAGAPVREAAPSEDSRDVAISPVRFKNSSPSRSPPSGMLATYTTPTRGVAGARRTPVPFNIDHGDQESPKTPTLDAPADVPDEGEAEKDVIPSSVVLTANVFPPSFSKVSPLHNIQHDFSPKQQHSNLPRPVSTVSNTAAPKPVSPVPLQCSVSSSSVGFGKGMPKPRKSGFSPVKFNATRSTASSGILSPRMQRDYGNDGGAIHVDASAGGGKDSPGGYSSRSGGSGGFGNALSVSSSAAFQSQPRRLNPTPSSAAPQYDFDVTPKVIDFGAITCGTKELVATMRVTNNSKRPHQQLTYFVNLGEKTGSINVRSTGEQHRISDFEDIKVVIPVSSDVGGRLTRIIKVRCLPPVQGAVVVADIGKNNANVPMPPPPTNSKKVTALTRTVMVKFNIIHIHFCDLDKKMRGMSRMLDFGDCYLPADRSKGASIPPQTFRFQNIYNKPLMISAESNLKRQINVFADEARTVPYSNIPVGCGEVSTCWVFLEPNLLQENSRVIHGGVQLFMENEFTCTVKVKATLGISRWALEQDELFLGVVQRGITLHRNFVVKNLTTKLPLRFSAQTDRRAAGINASTSLSVHIARRNKQEKSTTKGEWEVAPSGEKMVVLNITPCTEQTGGLCRQKVLLTNLITGARLSLQLFAVLAPTEGTPHGFLSSMTSVESVTLSTTFVDEGAFVRKSGVYNYHMTNEFADRDLLVSANFLDDNEVGKGDSEALFIVGVGDNNERSVLLHPLQHATIKISLFGTIGSSELASGLRTPLHRMLILKLNGLALKLVRVSAPIKRYSIDLGAADIAIGKVLDDQMVEHHVAVRNSVPELELALEVCDIDASIADCNASFTPGGGEIILRLSFHKQQPPAASAVPIAGTLKVLNRLNPMDALSLNITGTLLPAVVDISVDSLELPPLSVPADVDDEGLTCSAWFSVANVFGEHVDVDLSAVINPKLAHFFGASLLLRVSNVEIGTLSLGEGESKDVRVALMATAGARMSTGTINNTYLGTLVLEAKGRKSEVRLTGSLVPGKTFVLSTSQLVFYTKPAGVGNKGGSNNSDNDSSGSGTVREILRLSDKSYGEGFWVRSLSKTTSLRFKIISVPLRLGDDRLVLKASNGSGGTTNEECTLVTPTPFQQEYVLEPDQKVFVPIRLEPTRDEPSEPDASAVAADGVSGGGGGSGKFCTGSGFLRIIDMASPKIDGRISLVLRPDCSAAATEDADDEDDDTVREAPKLAAGPIQADGSVHIQTPTLVEDVMPVSLASLLPSCGSALPQTLTLSGSSHLGPAFVSAESEDVAAKVSSVSLAAETACTGSNALEASSSSCISGASSSLNSLSEPDSSFSTAGGEPCTRVFSAQPAEVSATVGTVRAATTMETTNAGGMTLRGCTPISGSSLRFEIDAGHHEYRSGVVEWEINVENTSRGRLEYEFFLVDRARSKEWIRLSQTAGTLNAEHDFESIVLRFSTEKFGSFSTYLLLVTSRGGTFYSIKAVHVFLEVEVTSPETLGHAELSLLSGSCQGMGAHDDNHRDGMSRFFSVLAAGRELSCSGESASLWLGQCVRGQGVASAAYSFAIKNESLMSLTFTLGHEAADKGTIGFALGGETGVNTPITVKRITVGPGSQQQVRMLIMPSLELTLERGIVVKISCINFRGHAVFLHLRGAFAEPQMTFDLTLARGAASSSESEIKIANQTTEVDFSLSKPEYHLQLRNVLDQALTVYLMLVIPSCFVVSVLSAAGSGDSDNTIIDQIPLGDRHSTIVALGPNESTDISLWLNTEKVQRNSGKFLFLTGHFIVVSCQSNISNGPSPSSDKSDKMSYAEDRKSHGEALHIGERAHFVLKFSSEHSAYHAGMASFGRSTVEERVVVFLTNLWRAASSDKVTCEEQTRIAWLIASFVALTDVLVFLGGEMPSATASFGLAGLLYAPAMVHGDAIGLRPIFLSHLHRFLSSVPHREPQVASLRENLD